MFIHHYNVGLLFDQVVAAHRHRPALRYADGTHSYADLQQWANQFGCFLLSQGLQRGDVIAIGHTKRPLAYALMLAALRLGIAYVTMDVASPLARNLAIVQKVQPRLIFCDDERDRTQMQDLADAFACPLFVLTADLAPHAATGDLTAQVQNLAHQVDGSCIAYIMFTSGSTGIPKGVAVTHQNILHFISWGLNRVAVTADDIFANLSPMYFDNSVFDFYLALFSGASLVPVDRELLTNPLALVTHVAGMACSIWFSVPSLLIYLTAMKVMTRERLPHLRRLVFGGEGYHQAELKKLHTQFAGQAELINVYGPTECTCICSAHTITAQDLIELNGFPTLGRLNCNFDFKIVDEDGHDSDLGELCLIGPNVAAGYYNDPERTALVFQTLTEPSRFGKRMYLTGDIVRQDKGLLYFVGRKDNQIKHMGYRIELEEIEHALAQIPQVNQAMVVYHRRNAAYGKLIGFVACNNTVPEQDILAQLGSRIPDYMRPSRIVVMTDLPKNQNGKVDRKHLLSQVEQGQI